MCNASNGLLLFKFAHLKTLNEGYQYKDVAANIRRHLKVKFPKTKFKVTTGTYKIEVSWTDACTQTDVDKALEVFAKGKFDGHGDDAWDIKSTAFTNLFGGVKMVIANRSYSDEYTETCIESIKAELGGENKDLTLDNFKEGLLIDIYPNNSEFSYAELLREKMCNQAVM